MMGAVVVACAPKAEEAAVEGEEKEATEVAPKEETAKDLKASCSEKADVAYLIGINFGSFIKGYNFGDDLSWRQIKKGMKAFINAKGNFNDPDFSKQFKVNPEEMNDIFNNYLEKRHKLAALENKEKGEKFLAANAKKAGVVTTESGLQYKIIEAGNDVKASEIDTVWVNYKGTLLDGTVFDQTPEDAEPVQFTLNRVIKGWTEGMQLVGEGGEIELYIPAELAYGEYGNQGIEPNSTLIFNVKISKVGKVAAEEAAAE